MSGFSESMMRERLQKLSNTQHSIQTVSLWILHHQKKHADPILDTWLKEVRSDTDSERLISLMNLANDVIQNARKKAPSFMAAFYEVLPAGMSHIYEASDMPHKKMLERILVVWRERQLYSARQLDQLKQCLHSSISSPNLNSDPETPIKSSPFQEEEAQSPIPESPETAKKTKEEFQAFSGLSTNMVNILRRLEDPASADVKIRQLIAKYPEQIANPSLLKPIKSIEEITALQNKITEATPVVDAYCKRLRDELKDRQALQFLIMDYTQSLERANERNKLLVDSVRKRITHLDNEKKELAKHIESLPDLSQMASSATALLPTLGELFTPTS